MKNDISHKLDFSPTDDALASGLIVGLCERLTCNPRVRELVAYVYALLDNEGSQALAMSRMMLGRSAPHPTARCL